MNAKTKTATTKRGRKARKFSSGRLPIAGMEFILTQQTNDTKQIQKDYHNKFGVWLKESRIKGILSNNRTATSNQNYSKVTTNSIEIRVKYKNKYITISEYLSERHIDIMSNLFETIKTEVEKAQ